jgi:spermidine synthase
VHWVKVLEGAAIAILLILGAGFILSDRIMSYAEASTFPDPVIYAKSSHYQRIVLTKAPHDFRLFLNGNLQFSSRDEYRYHEALIHLGLASRPQRKKILVLGGGDGLAVREILRYPEVESITLVDLDPEMTKLFSRQDFLVQLNGGAFQSSKVHIINADAFVWLKDRQAKSEDKFDFIVVDFPDPSNFSIGKLFSTAFYRILARSLSDDGAMVIQSTSPFVARKTFWCVDATLKAVGLLTTPYHVYVPSFGEWGFVLATHKPFELAAHYPAGLRYVSASTAREMLEFPRDMESVAVEPNRLNNQVLVRYFEEEWSEYLH